MHAFIIIVICIFVAVVYGIAHDQITARVCVEYFTIGHPPIFQTEDPTLLAIGWGIVATWWVGLLLGIPLAIAARAGNPPKRSIESLVRPIAILLAVMAGAALGAGTAGWTLASQGNVSLFGPIARSIPASRHVPYLADLWAHSASYLIGFLGGIVLIIHVWYSRRAPQRPGVIRT
jgi:hypothetical protein